MHPGRLAVLSLAAALHALLVVAARSPAAADVPPAASHPSATRPPVGRVEEFQVPSTYQHRMRRVWVYTPPLYDAHRDSGLAVVVAFDGAEYLDTIPLPAMLDSLIAVRRVPRTIALMIDDSSTTARLDDLANRAWFAKFVADELLPWLQARWRVTNDPHRVLVTGSSAGGLAAAYLALAHPDRFGNVLSQSGAFWRGNEASNDPPYQWLIAHARTGPRRDVRFWLEVGSAESRGTLGGRAPSILDSNRALRDVLRAKGYTVTYVEVPDGVHDPRSWLTRLPIGLAGLAGSMSER